MNNIELYIKNSQFIAKGTATDGGANFLGAGLESYVQDSNTDFSALIEDRIQSGESITIFNTTDSTSSVISSFRPRYNDYILMPFGIDIFDAGDKYSIGSATEWDRAELFGDDTIKLKQNIKNYRDVAKILTDFSQSFSLPASKVNNKLFDHYYNGDVVGGFDARFKVDARLYINGVLFREGSIVLQSVKMKNGNPSSYEINFEGKTPTLKKLFGDDKLDNLEYLDVFDLGYGSSTVKDLFDTGKTVSGTSLAVNSTDYPDICCPFISAKNRYYYNSTSSSAATATVRNIKGTDTSKEGINYKDLKPSIKVWHILKAIEAKYGFTFSTNFFSSTSELFKQLHLWCSRKSGQLLDGLDNKDSSKKFSELTLSSGTDVRQDTTDRNRFVLWSYEQWIASNKYKHLVYTVNVYPNETDRLYAVKIIDEDTGDVYAEFDNQVGDKTLVHDFAISVSDPNKTIKPTLVVSSATVTTYYATVTLEDEVTTSLAPEGTVVGSTTTGNYTIGSASSKITLAENIGFRNQVVPKIKVIDFLTGLFKMFNLVAYFEDNVLIVKTMDSYYTSGTTNYDITQYVDNSTATYKPSTVFSEINFEYKPSKTIFALKSNESTNDTYGDENFNSVGTETEFIGGKYDIKLPFERLLGENMVDEDSNSNTLSGLVWSYAVDKDENPVLNAPALILVKKKDISSLGAYVVNVEAGLTSSVGDAFPCASVYFDAGASPSVFYSINFGSEFSPTESNAPNENSLFRWKWQTYIKNLLYNSNTRVLTLNAVLPQKILMNYKLSDRFIISDRSYIISSIDTDLKTGESKLELITDNYAVE